MSPLTDLAHALRKVGVFSGLFSFSVLGLVTASAEVEFANQRTHHPIARLLSWLFDEWFVHDASGLVLQKK